MKGRLTGGLTKQILIVKTVLKMLWKLQKLTKNTNKFHFVDSIKEYENRHKVNAATYGALFIRTFFFFKIILNKFISFLMALNKLVLVFFADTF